MGRAPLAPQRLRADSDAAQRALPHEAGVLHARPAGATVTPKTAHNVRPPPQAGFTLQSAPAGGGGGGRAQPRVRAHLPWLAELGTDVARAQEAVERSEQQAVLAGVHAFLGLRVPLEGLVHASACLDALAGLAEACRADLAPPGACTRAGTQGAGMIFAAQARHQKPVLLLVIAGACNAVVVDRWHVNLPIMEVLACCACCRGSAH